MREAFWNGSQPTVIKYKRIFLVLNVYYSTVDGEVERRFFQLIVNKWASLNLRSFFDSETKIKVSSLLDISE